MERRAGASGLHRRGRPLTVWRMPTVTPFGSWPSPIDGAAVARDPGWGYGLVTPAERTVYWLEARPLEGGREAIVARTDGTAAVDVLPGEFSVRTRVHE